MKKFIATNCEFMLHEDDWFEGEGKLISSWVEDLGEADTIAELLGQVQYLDKCHGRCERIQDVFEHDPCYEDETGQLTVKTALSMTAASASSSRLKRNGMSSRKAKPSSMPCMSACTL